MKEMKEVKEMDEQRKKQKREKENPKTIDYAIERFVCLFLNLLRGSIYVWTWIKHV